MSEQKMFRLRVGLIAASLLASACLASATTFAEPITANSMVRWASAIFPGRVVSKNSYRDPQRGYVMTRFVIECTQVGVKGDLGDTVGKRTTATMIGGSKDGITTAVPGSPILKVGDRAVFFLEQKPNGLVVFTGLGYGAIPIDQDQSTGQDMVEVNWPVSTYGKSTVGDLERNARLAHKSLVTFLEDVKEVVRLEDERAKAKAERERQLREQQQKDNSGR